MRGWAQRRPARRVVRGLHPAPDAVLSAKPTMRPGTVIGSSVSLVVAGVLLARGFVGVVPSRPLYLVMGGLLAGTALLSLVIDHVAVRVRAEQPDHALVSELDRSRRYGHPLALVTVRIEEVAGLRVVSRLRATDRAWRAGASLVVLLTDTDHDGAVLFADRLSDLVPSDQISVAAFPEDAVTADGLFASLAPPEPRLLAGPSSPDAAPDAAPVTAP